MAAIERTAYPRFPPTLTATELQTLYAPTEEERAFVAAHARGPAQHLTLLTLLKCHQHLGYLPLLADVPTQIRTYLCQQLQLPPATYALIDTKATLARYRYLIRTYLALTPYTSGGPRLVMDAVAQAALTIKFIPLSFWYDAPLISRYSDRRHDPWLVYGLPSCSLARWSFWISRA